MVVSLPVVVHLASRRRHQRRRSCDHHESHVRHAWLGVTVTATDFGVVTIAAVIPEGPAKRAGATVVIDATLDIETTATADSALTRFGSPRQHRRTTADVAD